MSDGVFSGNPFARSSLKSFGISQINQAYLFPFFLAYLHCCISLCSEFYDIRFGKNLYLLLDFVTILRAKNLMSILGLVAERKNLVLEITEYWIDNYQSLKSQRYDNCTGRVSERMRLLKVMHLENDGRELACQHLLTLLPVLAKLAAPAPTFFSESSAAGAIARDVHIEIHVSL